MVNRWMLALALYETASLYNIPEVNFLCRFMTHEQEFLVQFEV